jgi:hypothetical protein
MAKFVIYHSRNTSIKNIVEFDAVFIRSTMAAGDQFMVYDTHHPWVCKIREVIPIAKFTTLICELPGELGWENQFTVAEVDTEETKRPMSFKYIK